MKESTKQAITWVIATCFGGLGGAVLNNWLADRLDHN